VGKGEKGKKNAFTRGGARNRAITDQGGRQKKFSHQNLDEALGVTKKKKGGEKVNSTPNHDCASERSFGKNYTRGWSKKEGRKLRKKSRGDKKKRGSTKLFFDAYSQEARS